MENTTLPSPQLKRKREGEDIPPIASPPKRKREGEEKHPSSFLKRIVVLVGRFGDSDDQSPIVKYWDPNLCSDPNLCARIHEKLKEPNKYHGFISYLLSGDDPLEESIEEDLLDVSPSKLGVREFRNSVCVDLDF